MIFNYLPSRKTADNIDYKAVLPLPEAKLSDDDTFIETKLGDRLDLLSWRYYGDVSFWTYIARVNNLPGDTLIVEPGIILRIPIQQDLYI